MKRVLGIILALVVLVAVAGGFYWYGRHEAGDLWVRISQEQIDSVLKKKFPKKKTYLKIINLTFKHPKADLVTGSERVRISLDVRASIGMSGLEKDYDGSTTATAGIRYDDKAKRFYLCDVVFERLDLPKIPENYVEKIRELATLASTEFVDEIPVHKLTKKDTKHDLARWLLREIRIEDDAVLIRLGMR